MTVWKLCDNVKEVAYSDEPTLQIPKEIKNLKKYSTTKDDLMKRSLSFLLVYFKIMREKYQAVQIITA